MEHCPNLVIKTFEQLSSRELYAILQARLDIFIMEQNCIYRDIDDVDLTATHIFYQEGVEICAYARIYWDPHQNNTVKIGRVIAVRRGTGLGGKLMKEAVKVAKDFYRPEKILIHAQAYARGFYEKAGFAVMSEETFLEDDIPHYYMEIVCG